jgi:hypothetical protein
VSRPRVSVIWADTIRQGTCESPRCRKTIYFAQNVRTKKFMPFSRRPIPLAVQPEIETKREQWTVDLATVHFADCVAAPAFRRRT